jgi:hypothetical protein
VDPPLAGQSSAVQWLVAASPGVREERKKAPSALLGGWPSRRRKSSRGAIAVAALLYLRGCVGPLCAVAPST